MNHPETLERGLWGVLATPFVGEQASVDGASLRHLVHDQLVAGASGLVVLGVFGEAARLTTDEQLEVVRIVDEVADGRPLVLGLAEHETGAVITQAQQLIKAVVGGTPSLMVQVPTTEPRDLAAHLVRIHEATGAGIVVQDYPLASNVKISSAALLDAVQRCSAVVAIKSEAPPTSSAIAELASKTDIPVFGGLGGLGLLDELMAGAAGAMTGFSHPSALRTTITAWEQGGYEAARATYLPWLPLVNFEAQAVIGLSIRKMSMFHRGLIADPAVRPPATPMPDRLRPLLESHLRATQSAGSARWI